MARIQKKRGAEGKKKKVSVESSSSQSASSKRELSAAKKHPVKPEMSSREVKPKELNVFQKGGAFLREVSTELKKVTWPTKKQTTGTTLVVLVFVFVAAAFLGLFDYSLSKLVQVVLTS